MFRPSLGDEFLAHGSDEAVYAAYGTTVAGAVIGGWLAGPIIATAGTTYGVTGTVIASGVAASAEYVAIQGGVSAIAAYDGHDAPAPTVEGAMLAAGTGGFTGGVIRVGGNALKNVADKLGRRGASSVDDVLDDVIAAMDDEDAPLRKLFQELTDEGETLTVTEAQRRLTKLMREGHRGLEGLQGKGVHLEVLEEPLTAFKLFRENATLQGYTQRIRSGIRIRLRNRAFGEMLDTLEHEMVHAWQAVNHPLVFEAARRWWVPLSSAFQIALEIPAYGRHHSLGTAVRKAFGSIAMWKKWKHWATDIGWLSLPVIASIVFGDDEDAADRDPDQDRGRNP